MKYKRISGAALFLTAAIALSACGASTGTSDAVSVAQSNVRAVSTLPDATPVDVDTTQSTAVLADAFSNRDLSGTWDAASAARITLNGSSISSASDAVTVSGSSATITAAGTYVLSGTLDNGGIIVDAAKEDKVQIVLNGVNIQSDTFAAIYVRQADKVFVTLADGTVNTLSNGGTFTAIDENNVDGVIFSKDDLTLNGTGKLTVTSPAKHGIVCKDDLVITGGTYEITAASHAITGKDSVSIADGTFTLTAGKDGVHSENDDDDTLGSLYIAGGTLTIKAGSDGVQATSLLQIDGGSMAVNASEGLEGTYVRINDGVINVYASDDGINAARKSGAYTPTVEINGGEVTVAVGPGDTDGIDADGNLIITGGTVSVTGNSAFDCDGSVTFTGGTVIVNGQQVDTIPVQRMGGGRGGMGRNFGGMMNPGGNAQNGTLTPGGRTWNGGMNPDSGTANPGDSAQNGTVNPSDSAQNGTMTPGGKGRRTRLPGASGTVEQNGLSGRTGRKQRPAQTETPDATTSDTKTGQFI